MICRGVGSPFAGSPLVPPGTSLDLTLIDWVMPQKAKYPVVRKFTIDTDGTSDIYVDVGRCLSMINHRLYRQGKMYRVRVRITDPSAMGLFAVTSLPDTWWARTAYNKARDLWIKRIEKIKKEQGTNAAVGRWNDFKIGYDETHRNAFTSSKLPELVTEATGTQAAMTAGNAEWGLSQLIDNDGNNNTFRFLGTASTSNVVNVVDAYADLTNIFAPDPDQTGSGAGIYGDFLPQAGAGDTGMDSQGDYPPYNETDFPQLEVHQGQLLSVVQDGGGGLSGAQGSYATGYFDAPLGLLRIKPGASAELTIEVQEGDYKGVNAPDWK